MPKTLAFTWLIAEVMSLLGLACGGAGNGGVPGGAGGALGVTDVDAAATAGAGGTGAGNTTGAAATSGGGNTTGSGAESGAGTGTGVGGANGTGATPGTGSGGAAAVTTCVNGATMTPAAALITDFSDAVADPAAPGQFKFGGGSPAAVQGGTAVFADTTETKPTLAITAGALSVMATSKGGYTGVALYMNGPACIDGSAYTGVRFELSGSLGACNLSFGFAFADDLSAASDPQRGICAATNCYGPSVAVTTTGTIKEPYTSVSGGSPDRTVDKQKLTGVQWQLQSAAGGTSCTAAFTLDNVRFY
jgi:hypothetical protein